MSAPSRRSAHNRPALIALVIVAALACLGLGWWQWERFESSSGTGQNLGYALQWPLFAAFAVFAYFRFVRLETEAEEPDGAEPSVPDDTAQRDKPRIGAAAGAARAARRRAKAVAPREIPAGLLPERPKAAKDDDPALADYNRYLAELHAKDIEDRVREAGLHTPDPQRSVG